MTVLRLCVPPHHDRGPALRDLARPQYLVPRSRTLPLQAHRIAEAERKAFINKLLVFREKARNCAEHVAGEAARFVEQALRFDHSVHQPYRARLLRRYEIAGE